MMQQDPTALANNNKRVYK